MLYDLPKTIAATDPSPGETPRAPSHLAGAHLRASIFCVAIYCAAVATIWPVVELATDDDFAYARMALAFSRTGHFIFNGWETAMVGWQVAWGALFVRLFGYSYLTLRFSVIVLGALLTLLLHRVLLRSGVKGPAAVFGTLTVVLSPLFLPMATSYMTDVPSMLCILVAIYGCQRALRARSDRTALAWLCGSAALNLVDGTVRQVAWLGTLVIIPSAFWLLRSRRGFKTAAVLSWVLSVIAISLVMLWFLHQPYSLPEHVIRGPITPRVVVRMLRVCVYGLLEVFCFSLPILIGWIFELRVLSRRRKLQIVALCAVVSPLLLWAGHYNKIQGRLPPWSANVVSRYGILWTVPLIGDRPPLLSTSLTSLTAVVLIFSLAGFLLWLASHLRRGRFRTSFHTTQPNELSLKETFVLLLPFSLSYLSLLLPRAGFPGTFSDVFDRYYLPLIMVAVILLSRLLNERSREIPVVCYVLLLVFSFFSIAATHDLFGAVRAAAAARSFLGAHGIAPSTISGPWEEDGGNQIDAQGYLNDDRLENPPNSYRKLEHPPLKQCDYVLGSLVPALHFQYVLTVEKEKCLVPSGFPARSYTSWLPPYHHQIYIERNPEP
jgi:hypothetical protein